MKKKLMALLLAFMMILSNFVPVITRAQENEGKEDFSYIGYTAGPAGVGQKLYVEKKDDASDQRVVYCFNKTLHWPDTKTSQTNLAYKKTTGSVGDFEGKVNENSKYKGQVLIDKLKVVLLNGYPNSNKIQNSLNLSDEQMRGVTQMAVWHFTDNAYTKVSDLQSLSDAEALAYAILVNMAEPTVNGKPTLGADVKNHYLAEYQKEKTGYTIPNDLKIDMPENSTLDLYIQNDTKQADGKGYQNLLGAFLINKTTKEIIEIQKEKSKKEINISKFGKNGQLAGAELSIAKADAPNTVIKTIKSSADAVSKIELEVDTEYILNETKAPEGYQKISGVRFKVDSEGNIKVIDKGQYEDRTKPDDFGVSTVNTNLYVTDKVKPEKPDEPTPTPTKTKVIIRKYAKGDYKKLLEGAELELYKISEDGKEGTIVEGKSFTSDEKGKEFELTDGSYILKEKNAPSGYKKADDINFEVKNGKVIIDDKEAPKGIKNPFSYEAYSDLNDDNLMVPGNPYGKFYYVKKSGKDQVVYCFNATKHAPVDSYDAGENIEYNPFDGGEIKYNKIINPSVLYKYAQNPRIRTAELATKVTRIINAGYPNNNAGIKNIGLTDTQLRAATQLAIYYYTDSADLTDEGLEKLGDGFQFLKGNGEEASKIKAYAQSLINYSNSAQAPSNLSYDFYVANNGNYQNLIGTSYDPSDLHYVISMEDQKEDEQPTPEPEKPKSAYIFFSKQDILGNELKGANLKIVDAKTNEIVKEWISDGSTMTFKLNEGSYKLVETAAPKGYKIATEINFSIDKNGKVTADEGSLKTSTGNNVLVMVDDYKESKIFFSKRDILGEELPGAKLQIKDKETGKVVQEWTSGQTPQTFGLKPGNYEFVETAAPKGYKIATSINFEITKDGEIKADASSLKTVGSSKILVMVDDYEEKPGEEKPENPGEKPSEEPKKPDDKPSEEPKKPDDKPSEEPKKPGDKPSEEPKKPGEKPSEKPKKPNGSTSENHSKKTNKKSKLPSTGDGINRSFYVALLAVVGSVTLLIGIKKRKNNLNEEEK